ncbi:MAG: hypothetical protein ABSH20_02390 [Tepidisphaeraceae bacterium]|jgi:hypothetical protein
MTEQTTPIRPALSECELPVAASVLVGVWCLTGAAACLGIGALLSILRLLGWDFVHSGPFPEIAVALAVLGVWWVCRWNRSLSGEDGLRTLGNWICGLTVAAFLAYLPLGRHRVHESPFLDPQSGLPFPALLWVSLLLAFSAVTHYVSYVAQAIQRVDLARFARRLQWLLPTVVVAGTGVSCITQNRILGSTGFDRGLPLASPIAQIITSGMALGLLWRLAPAVSAVVALAAEEPRELSLVPADGLTYEPPRATLLRQPLAMQIATRGAWGIFACSVGTTVATIVSVIAYWVYDSMQGRDDSLAATLFNGTSLATSIVFYGTPVLSILLAAWQKDAGKPPWRSAMTLLICASVGLWLLLSICSLPQATRPRVDNTVLAWLGVRWFIVAMVAHDLWWLLLCTQIVRISRALGREIVFILAVAMIGCILTNQTMTFFPSWFPGRGLTSSYPWFVAGSAGAGIGVQCLLWFFVAKGLDSLAQVSEQEQVRPAEPVAASGQLDVEDKVAEK